MRLLVAIARYVLAEEDNVRLELSAACRAPRRREPRSSMGSREDLREFWRARRAERTEVADAELARVSMKMSDDGRFVHDRRVGLMREVIVDRRSAAGTEQRLDRWEIRLVRGPQR